jgi:hypothetical protein
MRKTALSMKVLLGMHHQAHAAKTTMTFCVRVIDALKTLVKRYVSTQPKIRLVGAVSKMKIAKTKIAKVERA